MFDFGLNKLTQIWSTDMAIDMGTANFSAGGIATPADVSLVMQLGAEAVFVGSGIFKSEDPPARANAIVQATTYYQEQDKLAEDSRPTDKP